MPKSKKKKSGHGASVAFKEHKEEANKFICAWCHIEISGEVSLLQHVWGGKHQAKAAGRPLRLLPNRIGIVPELSPRAKQELASGGGFSMAAFGGPASGGKSSSSSKSMPKANGLQTGSQKVSTGDGGASQRVGLCKESEKLLTAALAAMPAIRPPAAAAPAASAIKRSRWDEIGHENSRETGVNAAGKVAQVPSIAHGNPALAPLREALPVHEHRALILRTIGENQVCIIEGETGCGKTTQVAQYIIEDAALRGAPCSVVCTQPRRISAISVAERVAQERGEAIGGAVGYSVRLESKACGNTCLLFCTTGILLRRLETDADLHGTTHVLVDEVHERGVESDFLLLALRDLSQRRRDLKVVMMSATMDKELFGNYFGGAPGLTIPGRTFPVETFFVEHALQATGHVLNPSAEWAVGKGKGKGKGIDTKERDSLDAPKREDVSAFAVQSRYGAYARSVQVALCGMEQDAVNYELVVQLLSGDTLARMGLAGAAEARPTGVLVFMSGAKEIENLQDILRQTDEFKLEPARSWVLPLHGGLPTDDQRKVFERPPEGVRKIVIATNVAETAITINDIGYVVDTCRMKEMRYDAVRCMSSLEDTVVSRTNARQRRGRAGRVAPGLCVHVGLTKHRHDELVDDHQPPEVQRTPLEHLVLRIHAVGLHSRDPSGKAAAICARLIEPPNPAFVAKAVEQLVRLGALELEPGSGREHLTALGGHLARLPLEARLGKLVLYGTAFGPSATDAALTVAAALTSRNPFLAPLECRDEAAKAKRKFADSMVIGPVGPSDHMAVLAAYREWDSMPAQGDARYEFCKANFLSIKTLQGMSELKRSLLETLSEAGFVRPGIRARDVAWAGRRRDGSDGVLLTLTSDEPTERTPPALIAALLCAALFPQVATATMPQVSMPKKQKTISNENLPKPKLVVRDAETNEPVKVKLHPGSVSAQETTLSSPYIVYQDLVKTTQLYIRDVTPVPPLALALFSGTLTAGTGYAAARGHAELVVDGWIKLAVPAQGRDLLLEMHKRLDAVFTSWVGRSRGQADRGHSEAGGAELLRAIVQLLSIQEECAPSNLQPQKHQQQQQGQQKKALWQGWKHKGAGPDARALAARQVLSGKSGKALGGGLIASASAVRKASVAPPSLPTLRPRLGVNHVAKVQAAQSSIKRHLAGVQLRPALTGSVALAKHPRRQ